ncbi:MAG TPA: hypothetical protein VN222_04645 [Novosphingobium sp.]|nr:hypothetical protein [Novosphingobium sp.]
MSFALQYERLVVWLVGFCPAPDKFAHMCAGLGIWLAAGLFLRRSLASVVPLLVVVAAEVANECVDRVAHGGWMWHDTLADAASTWFWPAVLFLALRRYRWLRAAA